MASLLFAILSICFKISYCYDCNYARDGNSYLPLETCFSYPDYQFSYYHKCYGRQLYDVQFSSIDCNGIPSSNATTIY